MRTALAPGHADSSFVPGCAGEAAETVREGTREQSFESGAVQICLDRYQLEAAMTPALAELNIGLEVRSGPWLDAWRRFQRNRAALVSGWIVVAIVLASLAGPWLVHLYNGFEYDTLGLDNRLANPTPLHPFGTDTRGRDLLARVLYGSRSS